MCDSRHSHEVAGDEDRLAAALASLVPCEPEIDLENALFEAGRRVGRRSARRWQGVCAVLVLCLGGGLFSQATAPQTRPATQVAEQTGSETESSADPQVQTFASADPDPGQRAQPHYLHLRDAVLARGMDALPMPQPSARREPPLRLGDLRTHPPLLLERSGT